MFLVPLESGPYSHPHPLPTPVIRLPHLGLNGKDGRFRTDWSSTHGVTGPTQVCTGTTGTAIGGKGGSLVQSGSSSYTCDVTPGSRTCTGHPGKRRQFGTRGRYRRHRRRGRWGFGRRRNWDGQRGRSSADHHPGTRTPHGRVNF